MGLIFLTMVLSLFGARLVQLQGLDPQAYAARAESEGLVSVPLEATRGDITDRQGVPLARSAAGLMVVADPQRTSDDAEAIARLLANKLGVDYFDTLERLRKPDTRFQYIAREVPAAKATRVVDAIEAAGYEGLDTRPDPLREYPAHDVAANLVGFMGNGDDAAPSGAGLELAFGDLLAGKDGKETYEVGGGTRIPLGENTEIKPIDGKDLRLTIDRDVQWYAQRVLRTAVQGVRAESGVAIALDTRTGEILALADYPTFDANDISEAPRRNLRTRALSDVYEPGSVEKVLTGAALIDQGLVSPRTRITVPGELPVMDRVIHDYFDHGNLRLTFAGVIAKSSNIGTVLAARQIDHKTLGRYLDSFGLGHRTGIGIPGESRGLVPDPDSWTDLTQATISFGQGISVNALQMAAAVNTIANGGEFVSPSLVKGSARTDGGDLVGTDTTTRHRVVSRQTARQVTHMMEMVTTEGAGTAPQVAIPGYRVAGKTGTAQQVGEHCGCYDGSLAVSFAGFAPADQPRFTVYVVIQRPEAPAGGGSTAGPVVRQILNYLLQKYAVPPTGTRPAHLPVEW
jgi:cell division protein FtsI (penicillin-binding protein 3)